MLSNRQRGFLQTFPRLFPVSLATSRTRALYAPRTVPFVTAERSPECVHTGIHGFRGVPAPALSADFARPDDPSHGAALFAVGEGDGRTGGTPEQLIRECKYVAGK